MALSPGTRIAAFEIIGSIGAGGMGEVYRATDKNLGRQVAIKVLPEVLAQNSDRLARFDREAKVLASLNHPNIAAIYGLERSPSTGSGQAGHTALVMELVEGPTLADRVVQGRIPVDEALAIAKQIADALEAAHEQGIVHRDLKPANVKVRPDGTVKVLDFGLAKALESSSGSDPVDRGAGPAGMITQSPTMAMPGMTQVGIILGTAPYMSPEQAKGRPVDRRADIWAFGCVLFEMLTGVRAFSGDDVSDVFAHILTHEPDWAALPGTLAPRAVELLRQCLQKDVKKRRRDAGDLALDLDAILRAPAVTAMPVAAPRRARAGWMAAAVFAAIAIGALAFAMRGQAPAAEVRLSMTVPAAGQTDFAISPDGSSVAMSAIGGVQSLLLRRLDRTDAQRIGADALAARFIFWSPDGRFVCYWSSGRFWKVDPAGGPPRVMAETPSGLGGATVDADGTVLFTTSLASPLYAVSAAGEKPVAITSLERTRAFGHMQPRFLPDGRHFLFYAIGGPDAQGVYLGSLESTEAKRLTQSDAHGEYLAPGYVVYVSRGALMARKLDLDRGELVGEAQAIADAVGYTPAIGLGAFSVSARGHIVYRSGSSDRRQLIWYDRTGRSMPVTNPDSSAPEAAELSGDGRRVAMDRTVQGNRDIWLLDLATGSLPRFTTNPAQDGMPVWSPDSKQIAFESKRKGPYDLYVKAVDGDEAERPILESMLDKWPMDWSRDGAYILYYETDPKTSGDLRALPLSARDGGREPIPVATGPFDENFGQFSPDGRWVAYQTDETGRPEVVVQSFPDRSTKRQVSRDGGTQPRWSHDGKELYFASLDSRLMVVRLALSAGSVEPSPAVALFPVRLSGVPKHQYSVAADGRFLVNEVVDDTASSVLTVVLNWKPK